MEGIGYALENIWVMYGIIDGSQLINMLLIKETWFVSKRDR